jgi:hypothetical protein
VSTLVWGKMGTGDAWNNSNCRLSAFLLKVKKNPDTLSFSMIKK